MTRLLLALVASLAPVTVAAQQPVAPVVPVVVIDGRGFGHGVGMAQDGAYWMGAAGSSTEQILGQFYPGTGLGKARGPVRVAVLDAGPAPSAAVVALPAGGELREQGSGPSSPGFPVRIRPGGEARVVFDGGGRLRVESSDLLAGGAPRSPRSRGERGRVVRAAGVRAQIPGLPPPSTTAPPASTTTTTAPSSTTTTSAPVVTPPSSSPSTTTTAPPAPPPGETTTTTTGAPAEGGGARTTTRPLVVVPADGGTVALPARQRQYRGTVEVSAAAGTLHLVNVLDVETYLKGMGEVRDPSWPPAALRAQAIAARTYAMRAMLAGGELCDTQRCQVYLGAQAEYAAMNKAVDATREQVLVAGRALASAVYSANGGGYSASREEGFGVADDGAAPYLRPAPYLTKDPAPWSVTVALTDVAARLGYGGALTDVRIARAGPSGRALEVVLDGSAGPKSVTGIAFDAALGLRSTLFTVRVDAAVAPPPPPPPAEEVAVQAPPEAAAAVVAEEVAGSASAPTTDPDGSAADRGLLWHRLDGGAEDGVAEELAIFGSWAALAAAGAVALWVSGRTPRRRPSPSAPPSGDDSP
jgi:SpoIID/LytB domain protein